ncbi:MAG: hypothetical protein IPG99_02915 [Ignavibacteria bacterium]|nr:hypothetical protein [Ignavibacteria bacterium]
MMKEFSRTYAKVFINSAEIQTDVMGRFTVMNVEFPYDLIVAERNTSTAVMYWGLSVTDRIRFSSENRIKEIITVHR